MVGVLELQRRRVVEILLLMSRQLLGLSTWCSCPLSLSRDHSCSEAFTLDLSQAVREGVMLAIECVSTISGASSCANIAILSAVLELSLEVLADFGSSIRGVSRCRARPALKNRVLYL